MRPSSLKFCPVPSEQQPLNEYEELKDSWFFGWATLTLVNYLKKLAWVAFWSIIIVAPIAAGSFQPSKHPWLFALFTTIGVSGLVFLVQLRLYLGWFYIHNRLNNPLVTYEESGWYDGQIWTKPQEIINRDRLIVSYEIVPILKRLRIILLIIASIVGLGIVICFWL